MKNLELNSPAWRVPAVWSATLIALSLSACATAGQASADRETCAGMGARYGSPAFTGCMLEQQQRRDNKMALFLEEQRMHQELGRPAREKARRTEIEERAKNGVTVSKTDRDEKLDATHVTDDRWRRVHM